MPKQFRRDTFMKISRIALKNFIADVKANSGSKEIRKSIKIAEEPSGEPAVVAGAIVRSRNGFITHYRARWKEFGVEGVGNFRKKLRKKNIADKRNQALNITDEKGKIFRMIFSRMKGLRRYRKDQPAQPFFRPAFDRNKAGILANFEKEIGDVAEKFLKANIKKY
jgi:hypothetical protein